MGGGAEPLPCELDIVSLRHDCGAAGSRSQGGRGPPTPDPHPASAVPPRAPAPQPSQGTCTLVNACFGAKTIYVRVLLSQARKARKAEGTAMKVRGEASTQPSRNGRRLRVWVCQACRPGPSRARCTTQPGLAEAPWFKVRMQTMLRQEIPRHTLAPHERVFSRWFLPPCPLALAPRHSSQVRGGGQDGAWEGARYLLPCSCGCSGFPTLNIPTARQRH